MPPQEICCKNEGEEPCPNCWQNAAFGCTNPCCWCDELEDKCEDDADYQETIDACLRDWRQLPLADRPCGSSFTVTVDIPSTIEWITGFQGEPQYADYNQLSNKVLHWNGMNPESRELDRDLKYTGTKGFFHEDILKSDRSTRFGISPTYPGAIIRRGAGVSRPNKADKDDLRRQGSYMFPARHGFSSCFGFPATYTGCMQYNDEDEAIGVWDWATCPLVQCVNGACNDISNPFSCTGESEEDSGWMTHESHYNVRELEVFKCNDTQVVINVSPDFSVCDETCSYTGKASLDVDSTWLYIGYKNKSSDQDGYSGTDCDLINQDWYCGNCECQDSNVRIMPPNNSQVFVADFSYYEVPINWEIVYSLRAYPDPFPDTDFHPSEYPNSRYFWCQQISLLGTPDWSNITVDPDETLRRADPVKSNYEVTQNERCDLSNKPYADRWMSAKSIGYDCDPYTAQPGSRATDCWNRIGCPGCDTNYNRVPGQVPEIDIRRTYVSPDTHSSNNLSILWGYLPLDPLVDSCYVSGPSDLSTLSCDHLNCGEISYQGSLEWKPRMVGRPYAYDPDSGPFYMDLMRDVSEMGLKIQVDYPSKHRSLPSDTATYSYTVKDFRVSPDGVEPVVRRDFEVTGEVTSYYNLAQSLEQGLSEITFPNHQCAFVPGDTDVTEGAWPILAYKWSPRDRQCNIPCPSSTNGVDAIPDFTCNGFSVSLSDFT